MSKDENPKYPFKYGKLGTGMMSKQCTRELTHTTLQQRAFLQPPQRNKKTQAAWTDKRTMVKFWHKERSKPRQDLTIKAQMEEIHLEVFKRVASEAKNRQWKRFCDILNRDTPLIHCWHFYRQTEGFAANTTIHDLINTNGAVPKTREEKA